MKTCAPPAAPQPARDIPSSYVLNVSDQIDAGDDAATVTLCMSRSRALALAYHINQFLAEMPDSAVCLPVHGRLLFA